MANYDTYEFKESYKDINTTLYWLVEQAKAGIDYCKRQFPAFSSPIEMFYYLKPRVTFHKDPPGTELIQSPGTMFENNYHGVPGAGDCDCFVTLLLACAWANGWPGSKIVLTGNRKRSPSHIYVIQEWNGEQIILDLTEPSPNSERQYKYKQVLNTI